MVLEPLFSFERFNMLELFNIRLFVFFQDIVVANRRIRPLPNFWFIKELCRSLFDFSTNHHMTHQKVARRFLWTNILNLY
jgi:hypothetical protein